MGFYFRKSISAGPFRFNLSGAGVGMSVGVKGFRVGTGPRGNYVHMGRGGLYYRASLGGGRQQRRSENVPAPQYPSVGLSENPAPIETGNVVNMSPSSGSELLQQINEKLEAFRLWPWALILGIFFSYFADQAQPYGNLLSAALAFVTIILTGIVYSWDRGRKTVVVMYDLADDIVAKFKSFSDAFEQVGSAARIWNIDTAASTSDWKRNAGAGRLITRKGAQFTFGAPTVIKTNISAPCILGGRQSLYFLPDFVLIVEGSRAGALNYDQLNILWNTTVFIENEGVPSDSQVVGHTWRFVNKNGGPDRRFNNNRQIPEVCYQQMGIQGDGGLRKILHLSKVAPRDQFDTSFSMLRGLVRDLKAQALLPGTGHASDSNVYDGDQSQDDEGGLGSHVAAWIGPVLLIVLALLVAWLVSQMPSQLMQNVAPENVAVTVEPQKIAPSFDCAAVSSEVLKLICSNAELAEADISLAKSYQSAMGVTSSPAALRASELRWIGRRNNSRAEMAVLRELYRKRIAVLDEIVARHSSVPTKPQVRRLRQPAVPPLPEAPAREN